MSKSLKNNKNKKTVDNLSDQATEKAIRVFTSFLSCIVVVLLIGTQMYYAFSPVRSLSIPEINETKEFIAGGVAFEYIYSDVSDTDVITTIEGWAYAGTDTKTADKYLVFENSQGEKTYIPMANDRIDRGSGFANAFKSSKARYSGFSAKMRLSGLLEAGVYSLGIAIHNKGTYYEQILPHLFRLEDEELSSVSQPKRVDTDSYIAQKMTEPIEDYTITSSRADDFFCNYNISIALEQPPEIMLVTNSQGDSVGYDISPFYIDGISAFTINGAGLPTGPELNIAIIFNSGESLVVSPLPEIIWVDSIYSLEIVQ